MGKPIRPMPVQPIVCLPCAIVRLRAHLREQHPRETWPLSQHPVGFNRGPPPVGHGGATKGRPLWDGWDLVESAAQRMLVAALGGGLSSTPTGPRTRRNAIVGAW